MNFFSEVAGSELACFWLALAAYGAFVFLAIATRAGSGAKPQSRFNALHLRSAILYVTASAAWLVRRGGPLELSFLGDFLIGLFIYFGVHYAIGGPFFVLAQASVSTSILSIVHARGGRATEAQCRGDYGGGQGFGSIKEQRMTRIQQLLGWVTVKEGKYALTRSGAVVAWLTKLLLGLWGLRHIGRTA